MTAKWLFATALLMSGAAAAQSPNPPANTMAPAPTPTAAAPAAVPAVGSEGALSKGDSRFIDKAASAGMAEVQEAQLAQQKSQDPKIKDFAQTMITDHTAANQQLAAIAQKKGVTVPASLDAKDQKELDKLQNLSGAKFDRAYMKGEAKDHQAVLKLLQKEEKDGKDADLKSFATQTIPTIQKHIDLVKADTPS